MFSSKALGRLQFGFLLVLLFFERADHFLGAIELAVGADLAFLGEHVLDVGDLAGFVALDLLLDHEQIGHAHRAEFGWSRAGYRWLTRIVRRGTRRHPILDRGDELAERRVGERDAELLER